MREILFRGKRVDNDAWVEGLLIIIWGQYHIIQPNDENTAYPIVLKTIGQFTGLTDKNGTKIFEGDIFKFEDEVWQSCYTPCGTERDSWKVENCGVVGFNEELSQYDFVRYKFGQNSVEANLHENHDMTFSEFITDLEVVGNIYDHPELLEGSENKEVL